MLTPQSLNNLKIKSSNGSIFSLFLTLLNFPSVNGEDGLNLRHDCVKYVFYKFRDRFGVSV